MTDIDIGGNDVGIYCMRSSFNIIAGRGHNNSLLRVGERDANLPTLWS